MPTALTLLEKSQFNRTFHVSILLELLQENITTEALDLCIQQIDPNLSF